MRRQQAGFTLLELLVSLTLLALLTVALVAALRFGVAGWRKTQETSLRLHAIRQAEQVIESDLGRIYPKFVDQPPAAAFVDFDGSDSKIKFFVPDPKSGYLLISVLSATGTAPALSLGLKSRPDIAPSTSAAQRVLLGGLLSIAFAYYGQAEGEKEPAWHVTWQGQPALPQLIRVRMASATGETSIPEVIVAPHIAADVGCVFDPVVKFCRGRK